MNQLSILSYPNILDLNSARWKLIFIFIAVELATKITDLASHISTWSEETQQRAQSNHPNTKYHKTRMCTNRNKFLVKSDGKYRKWLEGWYFWRKMFEKRIRLLNMTRRRSMTLEARRFRLENNKSRYTSTLFKL